MDRLRNILFNLYEDYVIRSSPTRARPIRQEDREVQMNLLKSDIDEDCDDAADVGYAAWQVVYDLGQHYDKSGLLLLLTMMLMRS